MQTLPLLSPFLAVGLYLILKKLGLLPGARASTAQAKPLSGAAHTSMCQEPLPAFISSAAPASPPAVTPDAAKPEPAMQEPRVVYENVPALHAFLNSEMSTWGKALYDPQCDEPLPPEVEHNLQALGGPVFLQQLCQMHNLDVQPYPKTPYECERAARRIIRTEIKQFQGERYYQ